MLSFDDVATTMRLLNRCFGRRFVSKRSGRVVDSRYQRLIPQKLDPQGPLLPLSSNPTFLLRKSKSEFIVRQSAILVVHKGPLPHLIRRLF